MLDWIFYIGDWPPRWRCGTWPAWLGTLHIASDAATFVAYSLLPLAGWWFLRRKPCLAPDVVLGGLTLCFILACGITHAISVVTFWYPAYHLWGLSKFVMAVVSFATVLRLWQVRRLILAYRTPAEADLLIAEKDAATARAEVVAAVLAAAVADRAREKEAVAASLKARHAAQIARFTRLVDRYRSLQAQQRADLERYQTREQIEAARKGWHELSESVNLLVLSARLEIEGAQHDPVPSSS